LLRRYIMPGLKPWSNEEFLHHVDPTKRKLYEQAVEELKLLKQPKSRITSFVKMEQMACKPKNLRNYKIKYKAPRMIQGRDPTFNVAFGRYIKRYEHAVCAADRKHGLPTIAKGFNDLELGEAIKRISSKFQRPMYLELDHTEFDAHVTIQQLEAEHEVYNKSFGTAELRRLCRRTINNKCGTRQGLRYRVKGTRMSGDMNTSIGNTLINIAVLKRVCGKMIRGKFRVFCNGDDSIVVCEEQQIDEEALLREFLKHNMVTKLDNITTNPFEVTFCQRKLVQLDDGKWFFCPDLRRILERFGTTHKYRQIPHYPTYLKEVAHCLSVIFAPLQPISQAWTNVSRHLSKWPGKESKINHLDPTLHRARTLAASIGERSGLTPSVFVAFPDITHLIDKVNRLTRWDPTDLVQNQHHLEISHSLKQVIHIQVA
jgi:hypothetical protein